MCYPLRMVQNNKKIQGSNGQLQITASKIRTSNPLTRPKHIPIDYCTFQVTTHYHNNWEYRLMDGQRLDCTTLHCLRLTLGFIQMATKVCLDSLVLTILVTYQHESTVFT